MENIESEEFRVMVHREGIWDNENGRIIEAETALKAAEIVRGCSLSERGTLGQLRAQVWRQNSIKPESQCFYSR